MEKFMFLFRGGTTKNLSAEENQSHMQKWYMWMQELKNNGVFVSGEPLHMEGTTVAGTNKVVTDGPFTEVKELVGGYMVVTATDMKQAVELSKGCPTFELDGSVEVRQVRNMNM